MNRQKRKQRKRQRRQRQLRRQQALRQQHARSNAVLTARTRQLVLQEVNDVTAFAVKQAGTTVKFVIVLAAAALFHWFAAGVVAIDPTLKSVAAVLSAAGNICLLIDALWLTNLVFPWVPILKRWIARETSRQGK